MSLVLLQDLVNKNSTFKLTHHHLTLHFFSGWFYQDQGRQSNISISLTSAVCFTCDQVGKDHKNMIQTNNVSVHFFGTEEFSSAVSPLQNLLVHCRF